MTTDYDPIAEQYRLCKRQEWRVFVEAHTLMEIVGTERGAALDIACGEGFYTRLLRQRGAARVTGIDLSSQMIELARRQEALLDLGVTYLCGDATRLPPTAEYDLALAAYLLNYAHDRSELQAMCSAIAGVIKPGGRFITVNCNPERHFPRLRRFGSTDSKRKRSDAGKKAARSGGRSISTRGPSQSRTTGWMPRFMTRPSGERDSRISAGIGRRSRRGHPGARPGVLERPARSGPDRIPRMHKRELRAPQTAEHRRNLASTIFPAGQ